MISVRIPGGNPGMKDRDTLIYVGTVATGLPSAPTNYERMQIMAKDNLTAEVKIRLTADEKSRLKQLADDAELTMSEMIRATIFSQKKLVFLVQGADIAAAMFQIRKELEQLYSESVIPASEIDRLQNAIESVGIELHAIRKRLSDLHDEDEEAITVD